jgi:hypothetical protein
VSTCQLCVVGNEAPRAALTLKAGLWEYPERQDKLASALVLPEIGVLGFDGQFPQTCSQVSAMRLSRSLEEGLWHAS